MQSTTLGANVTGAALAPDAVKAMGEACAALSPFLVPDTSAMEAHKLAYAAEADAVGSVPVPPSLKGLLKTGIAKIKGGQPTVLVDKLGERLAFERSGTRLYDALILKYQATVQEASDALPAITLGTDRGRVKSRPAEDPGQTLLRIRNEELSHFLMLNDSLVKLGADPTAITPCADVIAVQSMGFMQVLNDPRTTLAQCLNTMLAAELADNAGWELLAQLADGAGEDELAARCLAALAQEQEHLAIVKAWLTDIVHAHPQPAAV